VARAGVQAHLVRTGVVMAEVQGFKRQWRGGRVRRQEEEDMPASGHGTEQVCPPLKTRPYVKSSPYRPCSDPPVRNGTGMAARASVHSEVDAEAAIDGRRHLLRPSPGYRGAAAISSLAPTTVPPLSGRRPFNWSSTAASDRGRLPGLILARAPETPPRRDDHRFCSAAPLGEFAQQRRVSMSNIGRQVG